MPNRVLSFAATLLIVAACASPPAAPSPSAPTAAPGQAAPTAAPQATAAPAGGEIVIGGTVPLTGPYSEPGRWYQRIYEWYFRELNARGGLLGRPVRLILYDDESDPNKAAQEDRKSVV